MRNARNPGSRLSSRPSFQPRFSLPFSLPFRESPSFYTGRFRALVALALAVTLFGCGSAESEPDPSAEATSAEDLIAPGPHDIAVLEIRGMGTIRFELLPELAPATVGNFTKLARNGTYDGTTFHRVIPGFMIQGGDPNSKDADPRNDGRGGGTGIPDEFTPLPQLRGIVSLANRGNHNSGGSQFFIVHQDAPHLTGHYTAFGRVIEGMEVVDAITEMEIDTYGRYGPQARPYPKDAVIESVEIVPAQQVAS